MLLSLVVTTCLAQMPDAPTTDVSALAERLKTSVVVVVGRDLLGMGQGMGTGFFVSEDGALVTNHHVATSMRDLQVVTPDGMRHRVLGALALDRSHDLALLQVEGQGFPVVRLAEDELPREGSPVVVLGNPLGLSWTISQATVSAIRRETAFRGSAGTVAEPVEGPTLQLSGNLMGQGNSGSPVVDSSGALVGVIYSGIGEQGGISFAIPTHRVSQLLREAAAAPFDIVESQQAVAVSTRSRNLLLSGLFALVLGGFWARSKLRERKFARAQSPRVRLNA